MHSIPRRNIVRVLILRRGKEEKKKSYRVPLPASWSFSVRAPFECSCRKRQDRLNFHINTTYRFITLLLSYYLSAKSRVNFNGIIFFFFVCV